LESKHSPRIGVLGSGSWATALVKIFSENSNRVNWYVRSEEKANHIRTFRHNPKYLASVSIDLDKVSLYQDLLDFVRSTDILVVAIPAAFIHQTLESISAQEIENKWVISAVKGMIPEFHAIPARYFHKTLSVPYQRIGLICGPCHAEEIALERLSYLTVGSENQEITSTLSQAMRSHYLRVNESDDLFGAELSAILKNVYAIASGICSGLGYGDNFQAILVSNAIQEISRFLDAVHPIPRDIHSSAYLGDLVVTCYSKFSRNSTFGYMIGKGYTLKSAQLELGMVAEGYYAVSSLVEINKKFQVELPILQAVYHILYDQKPATKTIESLTLELQ
jgi:glycerol-3-phosphate dehydrogenase (NAD(P)+)